MIAAGKISRIAAVAALFGVALYAAVYLLAGNSEGFEFIEQRIRNSQDIKRQVGEISKVRPSLLGFYDEKTVGADQSVSMTIIVFGAVKTIELDVKAKKSNGVWGLEAISESEQNADLK